MSNFPILDLVGGLIFIFFLLSIICSSMVEIIWSVLKIRAKLLTRWLITVFNQRMPAPPTNAQNADKNAPKQNTDNTLGEAILNHCFTTVLSGSKLSTSYIHPADFTTALLDLVRNAGTSQSVNPLPTSMKEMISVIGDSPVLSHEQKRTLATFAQQAIEQFQLQDQLMKANQAVNNAKTEFEFFRSSIDNWYQNTTQRLTGNLKRQSQVATFIVATLFVFAVNADSIEISKFLYGNKDAREQLAKEADHATNDYDMISPVQAEREKAAKANDSASIRYIDNLAESDAVKTLQQKAVQIDSAYAQVANSVPLGWKTGELSSLWLSGAAKLLTKTMGLIATILAIMLGAPFWFDLLNKVANLRGSGPKPDFKPDSNSKNEK